MGRLVPISTLVRREEAGTVASSGGGIGADILITKIIARQRELVRGRDSCLSL